MKFMHTIHTFYDEHVFISELKFFLVVVGCINNNNNNNSKH